MALNRETRYTARLEPGLRLSLTSIFIAALFCDALDPQIMPFFEKAVRVFRSQSGIPQVSYSYHYNMWFSNLLDPNSPLGDMFRYVFIEMLNHNMWQVNADICNEIKRDIMNFLQDHPFGLLAQW